MFHYSYGLELAIILYLNNYMLHICYINGNENPIITPLRCLEFSDYCLFNVKIIDLGNIVIQFSHTRIVLVWVYMCPALGNGVTIKISFHFSSVPATKQGILSCCHVHSRMRADIYNSTAILNEHDYRFSGEPIANITRIGVKKGDSTNPAHKLIIKS